jgi:L-threonylcarbamoyladenylate synthase
VTDLVPIDARDPDDALIAAMSARLAAGEVLALPTDTVYGLAADVARPDAIHRIFQIKERPTEKALVLFVEGVEDAAPWLAELPEALPRLATRFWPGPLTIVVRASPAVPPEVSTTGSVALRQPDHAVPRALVRALGRPLVTTSANLSGRPSLADAAAVRDELAGRLSWVLDAGPARGGRASTVITLAEEPPRVLREGPIPAWDLREVLPTIVDAATAPG